jgi:hypothetical protein
MHLTVRLGEPFWRLVQAKEVSVELPTGATVGDLLAGLARQYPELREALEGDELPPTVFLGEQIADSGAALRQDARPTLVWALAGG